MAQGKFGGGQGIPSNPYLIEDVSDLNAIRFSPGSHYKLATSINLGILPYNTDKGWLPIKDFTGTLDGNNKKIYNLYINRPTKDYVGLFETFKQVDDISGVRVFNLGIERANIIGKTYAGALAGALIISQTTGVVPSPYIVDRCYFTGSVQVENYGGGIFGAVNWGASSQAAIFSLARDVFVDVSLQPTAANDKFGAIAGQIDNSATKNFVLSYVFSTCSFSNVVGGIPNTALIPKSYGTLNGTAAWNSATVCYYDSTRWPFSATASTTGKTTAALLNERWDDYDQRILDDGTLIWNYSDKNRYPMLRQFFLDRYFVRTSNGYCVYENDKWVMKYKTMPTREQAVNTGMKHLSNIPYSAWDALRQTEESIDLLNILELSNGTTQQSKNQSMTLDSSNSNEDKNYFRKEVQFNDFGTAIVAINKGVTA